MIVIGADSSDDGRFSQSKTAALDSERQPLVTAPPPYFYSASRGNLDPSEFTVPAAKRFIRAFAIALLIYVLGATAIGSLAVPSRIRYRYSDPKPGRADGETLECHLPFEPYVHLPDYGLPEVEGMEGTDHSSFPEGTTLAVYPPYASRTAFTLPGDSSLLFLLARGSLAHGSVVIRVSESASETNLVAEEVVTRFWSLEARNRANICLLTREEGAHGLGIYTPRGWPVKREDMLSFELTLTLPRGLDANSTRIRGSLDSNMPLFAHDLAEVSPGFLLHSLRIKSSNSPIRAKMVEARSIDLKTTNAPISGSYAFRESLSLVTSNSPIDVKARAHNQDWHTPATIRTITSNARIQLESSLDCRDQTISEGAGIQIQAKTSNGRLNVTMSKAAWLTHIQLDARTSNADAYTRLPSAFEGKISLKNSMKSYVMNDPTSDPTGGNLKRTFHVDQGLGGDLQGRVWWGEEKDYRELGRAKVTTSNGRNVVELL